MHMAPRLKSMRDNSESHSKEPLKTMSAAVIASIRIQVIKRIPIKLRKRRGKPCPNNTYYYVILDRYLYLVHWPPTIKHGKFEMKTGLYQINKSV